MVNADNKGKSGNAAIRDGGEDGSAGAFEVVEPSFTSIVMCTLREEVEGALEVAEAPESFLSIPEPPAPPPVSPGVPTTLWLGVVVVELFDDEVDFRLFSRFLLLLAPRSPFRRSFFFFGMLRELLRRKEGLLFFVFFLFSSTLSLDFLLFEVPEETDAGEGRAGFSGSVGAVDPPFTSMVMWKFCEEVEWVLEAMETPEGFLSIAEPKAPPPAPSTRLLKLWPPEVIRELLEEEEENEEEEDLRLFSCLRRLPALCLRV